jgi:hypothetical protein
MDAYADAVATALDDPDPWHGFTGYLEAACAMQAADYGFADVLTMTFPTAKAMETVATRPTRACCSSSTAPRPPAGSARTSTPRIWC